jgi:hypothetical protein
MPKYQGKEVKARELKQGDAKFDPNKPQMVITHDDGREETVAKNDVTQ